jgi:hypothetical protein
MALGIVEKSEPQEWQHGLDDVEIVVKRVTAAWTVRRRSWSRGTGNVSIVARLATYLEIVAARNSSISWTMRTIQQ